MTGIEINHSIHTGKLMGVSLGPGNPGLITRRAWQSLHGDAVWTYPVRRKNGRSFALDIALRAGTVLPADSIPLVFPMTHDAEKLARHWLLAAETVLQLLYLGRDVVFLVEGDASTYSTWNHLSRTVRALDDRIELETIAGVSSFQAAAAQLRMPLADVDDTVAILPAAYGVAAVERLLPEFDTLVLLKVKPLLDDLIDLLARRDLLQHACFVEKVGAEEERVIRDIVSLRGEKVNYLSLLLVRNPHRNKGERLRGCRKKADNENINGLAAIAVPQVKEAST
ncbi:MAG TPA: precorrin-2 C(20)-methyltransferase [Candidatus Kapabacteria bacterium]|nr:precorrin-2 C(20)-methyltransferase [Candidatus Kapabacteria bacterium]